MNDKKYPKRKHPRLKDNDYRYGYYFVTICVKDKKRLLSRVIVGRDAHIPPQIKLSSYGKIVEENILKINEKYENAKIENYIIMPNHIHFIVALESERDGGMWASRPTSLITIVKTLKTLVTKKIGISIWQSSFYEEGIRSQKHYENAWNYIEYNALKEYAKETE
ncbi:MAG: transposase [Clostridia bacterium]|nr:transposase [Clostridia bacterium]